MAEDQLTRGERLRLESLSMALNAASLPTEQQVRDWANGGQSTQVTEELILQKAERIEAWLKRADEDHMKGAN